MKKITKKKSLSLKKNKNKTMEEEIQIERRKKQKEEHDKLARLRTYKRGVALTYFSFTPVLLLLNLQY